jgi:hypothetical protein
VEHLAGDLWKTNDNSKKKGKKNRKFEQLKSSLYWSLLQDRGFIILAGLKTLGIPKDFYILQLKHVSLFKDMIELKHGKIELIIFKRYSYFINSMISKRCVIKKGMDILKVMIIVILGIVQTKEWS